MMKPEHFVTRAEHFVTRERALHEAQKSVLVRTVMIMAAAMLIFVGIFAGKRSVCDGEIIARHIDEHGIEWVACKEVEPPGGR